MVLDPGREGPPSRLHLESAHADHDPQALLCGRSLAPAGNGAGRDQPSRKRVDVPRPGATGGGAGRPFSGWAPDWRGACAVVVAGGPSAAAVDLARARGKARALAVNEGWQLAPWAEVLYACDGAWWGLRQGVQEFAGLKVTADHAAALAFPGLHLIRVRHGIDRMSFVPGEVGWGGNSGFHAVNLAAQFGAARIVLVGFDMHVAGGVHWHGRHPRGLNNPDARNTARWRRLMDAAAPDLAARGIEVLNASPTSALTAYAKVHFDDLF